MTTFVPPMACNSQRLFFSLTILGRHFSIATSNVTSEIQPVCIYL